VALCIALAASMAWGQPAEPDLADRPIAEVRIEGLERVSEQLVRNQLRSAVGDPYDPETVRADVALLQRLGEFQHITAEAMRLEDGSVRLIYQVTEAPIIVEVQVVGNKVLSDQELLAVTGITRGFPGEDYLIENAKRAIVEKYRSRGYYLTSVTVDESELKNSGILFFRIIEGPRVKVRAIVFEGNHAFTSNELHAEIKTRTAVPLIRRGELDEDRLRDDVAALDRFYKDRGFLDVRVDRTIELSPDQTEAKITFLIVEGRQFTLRAIRTEPADLQVFTPAQIEGMIEMKPGDVYRREYIARAVRFVEDAYFRLGFADARVSAQELRTGEAAEVDMLLVVHEGQEWNLGNISIIGNFLTRDSVIRRHLRTVKPGRPLDQAELRYATEKIRATRLFSEVNVAVQDPDPARPGVRDVVVEVREDNTGSVNFGIAAGSDTGFFGEFSINQRNFDITDLPESPGELITGRAFRGGGQNFTMSLRPGPELFQYIIAWNEPSFLDSEWSLGVSAQYMQREYQSNNRTLYDENQIAFPVTVGRRLGDVWNLSMSLRAQRVKLTDIAFNAPVDVFEDAGPNTITSLTFALTRSTVHQFRRPSEGTRFEIAVEQTGVLGGDFDYTKLSAEYTVFLTVYRDSQGRAHILKLNSRAGYIAGDAPVYDKFYMGGRNFRGFQFRTISPKGIRADTGTLGDDPVGGDWMFFAGVQYEIPIFQEALTTVLFIDSGTVTNDVGFDQYRVSAGIGLRIHIDQFGPVPIALDFGFPIKSEEGDEEETFSFSAELPF
jgi:outer membrane protein insertion porin family